ncbi:MAG: phosphatidylserine decarboxylase [Jiangellales bacterium]
MTIVVSPIPAPEDVAVLAPLMEHRDDEAFVAQLAESLSAANDRAGNGALRAELYSALPKGLGMDGWPTTFDEYVYYLVVYGRWLPQQSSDPAWTYPGGPVIGDHREVYDYLCWFYWLIDQPLDSLGGGVLQDVPWFADFLVAWADAWGAFLDSPESFDDHTLTTFISDAPRFRVRDSMIGEPPRSNNPSGWLTFNQFFARELNPGLRPVSDPADNTTVVVPADCTFNAHYEIDDSGAISPPITIKGTHTYATVQQLLEGSGYADAFNGGHFIHLFLGPYSYHRFHTPVAGTVRECYPLAGQVYLKVALSDGQFDAADSSSDGYEFLQARGVLTIDTSTSPSGDIGIVAVLPIGMCQVSGVNMTHETEHECAKGDEFGYFTFGGSDIIIVLQKGAQPEWNAQFTPGTSYYSLYGTPLAQVSAR